ncbi:MAG TPA: type II toxin-antitoxin system PemK/MazF family toxin [Ktedonobacterales bacterium]
MSETPQRRWSVVRVDFGQVSVSDVRGHEQAGIRPAIIVSNEGFNRHSGLFTIVPLTSEKEYRPARPNEIALPAGTAGLPFSSIALPHQIRTISALRVKPPLYGRLADKDVRRALAKQLLLHLGLEDLEALQFEQ